MRPYKMTAIHKSGDFAELVCSNSLRSNSVNNAVGLLKQELRELDSLIMRFADSNAIPAGSALAVDRENFSRQITEFLQQQELVEVCRQQYEIFDDEPTIVASGPLTSESLSQQISSLTGSEHLYFYDAVAPIVTFESINMAKAYYKSRYDKGEDDYINCPLTKTEFTEFYQALIEAEIHETHQFEEFFPGCLPVEELAKKGEKTLLFGPLKPVGLEMQGQRPYGVVQLRRDNVAASLYNLVGFQTQLTWPEQKRVFRMIPALENCEIVRYGVMHRNTYINSPLFLDNNYRFKDRELFFAGQITGVEGYIESTASGWLAGVNMARLLQGRLLLDLDSNTMIGALANYIAHSSEHNFQPLNANYGIMNLGQQVKKADRKTAYYQQSQREIEAIKAEL
jgi:methylenetetrahydrofolate--tRNA-(uracil-5-)-methyltransferase